MSVRAETPVRTDAQLFADVPYSRSVTGAGTSTAKGWTMRRANLSRAAEQANAARSTIGSWASLRCVAVALTRSC